MNNIVLIPFTLFKISFWYQDYIQLTKWVGVWRLHQHQKYRHDFLFEWLIQFAYKVIWAWGFLVGRHLSTDANVFMIVGLCMFSISCWLFFLKPYIYVCIFLEEFPFYLSFLILWHKITDNIYLNSAKCLVVSPFLPLLVLILNIVVVTFVSFI